jgi:hypothetical protein
VGILGLVSKTKCQVAESLFSMHSRYSSTIRMHIFGIDLFAWIESKMIADSHTESAMVLRMKTLSSLLDY